MDAKATHVTDLTAESIAESPEGTYDPPRLERLGKWKALTLQQTIPISPDILDEGMLPILPGL
jgi:hypothetical protein